MNQCPSIEQLESYLHGECGHDDLSLIEPHIESCRDCQSSLAELTNKSDPVSRQTHQTVVEESPAGDQNQQDLRGGVAAGLVNGSADTPTRHTASDSGGFVEPFLPSIPGYEITGVLGRGGMGAVFDAVHQGFGRPVAIKILPETSRANPTSRARFAREMAAIGQLDHPNIVQAFDAAEHDGLHYLVMERVDGQTASAITKRLGCLEVADACEIIRQAAIGLQHAFESGLVHRDLKPSNMMISHEGTVKLLDLGLARLTQDDDNSLNDLTSTGQIMGTINYMAPEQAAGQKDVGITADIYSLGATLYQFLAGQIPFSGEKYQTVIAKLNALANETPTPLGEIRPGIPKSLESIVHRMLSKDPARRFAQPVDVAYALTSFCERSDLAGLADVSGDTEVVLSPTRGVVETSENELQTRTAERTSQSDVPKERSNRTLLALTIVGVLGITVLGVTGLGVWLAVAALNRPSPTAAVPGANDVDRSTGIVDVGPSPKLPAAGPDSAARHLQLVGFAEHSDLEGTTCVQVSPDGRHIYATSLKANVLSIFERDGATGKCRFLETMEGPEFYGAIAVKLNRDGTKAAVVSLYAKNLVVFDRNAETGALIETSLKTADAQGPSFGFPKGVQFSPDSRHLFVLDALYQGEDEQGAVVSFRLDEKGDATFLESNPGRDSCFHFARQLEFNPASDMMYVTSTSAQTLTRLRWNRETGTTKVEQVLREGENQIEGLSGAFSVGVSDDGRFVYVSSGRFDGNSAVSVFSVGDDDSLSVIQELIAERDAIRHFAGSSSLSISPDGRYVYVSCTESSSVVAFARDSDSGRIRFVDSFLFDEGDAAPAGLSISPDGRFVYVALEGNASIAILRRTPSPILEQ